MNRLPRYECVGNRAMASYRGSLFSTEIRSASELTMIFAIYIVLVSNAITAVSGAIHNLFVGNLYVPASVYSLEFNDETNSLKIIKNITADTSHAWIAFSVRISICMGAETTHLIIVFRISLAR
jgi:hypothetical protein